MDKVNAVLNETPWGTLLGIGFALGACFTVALLHTINQWVNMGQYMPGPFARPDIEERCRNIPPPPTA